MSTATRSVLFTDLAGYTARVSRADRESLRKILEEHHGMVEPVVLRNGGRIVKNLGDSYMCLLNSATDAVKAGLEILDAMPDGNREMIRIAIETGDVEEIDGDAFGEPVNLAARILSKTPAGELWFGPGTRVCMNESEVSWATVGRFAFKGIAGEPACYRAVPPGQVWLSEAVIDAVTERRLVRITPDHTHKQFPPDPVLLLEGFSTEIEALRKALKTLPVVRPEHVFLATATIAAVDRLAWKDAGYELAIGNSDAIHAALSRAATSTSEFDISESLHVSETMVVTGLTVLKRLELTLCGLALPTVPFSGIVAGYSYDLLADGSWATRADQCVMRVDVRQDGVLIHALRRGIEVDGHPLRPGTTITPRSGAVLKTPGGELQFRAFDETYAGALFFESEIRLGIELGQTVEIGRSPNAPGLALPSRGGKSNIRWCEGEPAQRAKSRGFTLDRVLAGRRQASLQMSRDGLRLTPLHKTCPTYVIEQDKISRIDAPRQLNLSDHLIAGTNIVGLRTAA